MYINTLNKSTSPSHYTMGRIEVIDALYNLLTPQQFKGLLMGNCLKYIYRHEHKGSPLEDLKKARTYLNWMIEIEVGK